MNDPTPMMDRFEERVAAAARNFPFPAAPAPRRMPVSGPAHARRPRPALALAAVLLLLVLTAFAVPPVRAAIVEFIQVGVIRIFFDERFPETETPLPTPLPQLRELAGRTTIVEAIETAGIPVLYPTALGVPDEVYVQMNEGPLVLMVWTDGDELQATLLALGPNAFAGKGAPRQVVETTVGGQRAIWAIGEHYLELGTMDGDTTVISIFTAGNALIWEAGPITYRLEGFDEMEEAIRIAETLPGTP